ncbi:uncharacterized protein LOC127095512 [Lathyrus oleraceus]|uniref:uncharacterized protein LOC127095512 n=2 Tax=Pisum sativum TaxID=3888 RepID=UPI0021CE7CBC|nr:uncharacterized protein LOC127095512 [Pisum sativum]
MYKKAWKSFKELSKDEKDEWFDKFKEKCTWNVMDEYMIRKNYRGRTSVRLSDMLRRVRLDWEERNIRPNWIGKEVFDELLAYWATDNFKAKSQKAKDMRASERGGCLNATGSISIGEHAKRMTKAQGRPPRLNELFVKTRTKKSGDLVDDRSRRTIEEYQRLLTQFLVENPQYTPVGSNPLDPRVDMYIWSLVTGGKGRNGCFFGVGPLAGNYRTGDRTLFDRVASGEGTSRPTQLTPEMMETVRQLALTEARRETAEREAALKAELEEMKKRQHDMEEQMRQFMQSMSRNQNQRTTEDDEDDDEFDVSKFVLNVLCEIDSEEESDSDSDSDGDSDSGDPNSDGDSDSGGSPDSGNIPDSEGGRAYEVGTSGVPTSDIVPESEDFEQVQRPQRIRNITRRFAEFDMLQHTEVDSEGEFIQCSMFVFFEPVSTEEALKHKV